MPIMSEKNETTEQSEKDQVEDSQANLHNSKSAVIEQLDDETAVVKETHVEVADLKDGKITKTLKQEAHFVDSLESDQDGSESDLNGGISGESSEETDNELNDPSSENAVAGILSGLGMAGARASTDELNEVVVEQPQKQSSKGRSESLTSKVSDTVSRQTDKVNRKIREHVDVDAVHENITSGRHWMRFVYMLGFALALYFVPVVYLGLIVIQALVALFRGEPSLRIREFSSTLNQFVFQALEFLLYNSDKKPFPFNEWPEPKLSDTEYENDNVIVDKNNQPIVRDDLDRVDQ